MKMCNPPAAACIVEHVDQRTTEPNKYIGVLLPSKVTPAVGEDRDDGGRLARGLEYSAVAGHAQER